MIVKQLFIDNALRNFNYLIVCPVTGDALAIDPLAVGQCLQIAKENDWHITQIVNTHEHGDHTGGNLEMIHATNASVLAHFNGAGCIPGMTQSLRAGDVINVGSTIELEVLDTPGHTFAHVCLLAHSDKPALFTGDTLFNAGAGNCYNGGSPEKLFETFSMQLDKLPDETRIYPGHEYIHHNLQFTLNREPENLQANKIMQIAQQQDPHMPLVTTLGLEKKINTFFRLKNPNVIKHLREAFPGLPNIPSEEIVFLKLRELRDQW